MHLIQLPYVLWFSAKVLAFIENYSIPADGRLDGKQGEGSTVTLAVRKKKLTSLGIIGE